MTAWTTSTGHNGYDLGNSDVSHDSNKDYYCAVDNYVGIQDVFRVMTNKKPPKIIKFERPQEGKIDKEIGNIKTFHVEKGEEKHTFNITTKRELTFNYTIRAKNEEDAMIRTLKFVGSDGSGVYMQGPMLLGKPLIREWIERIEKIG